MRLLEGEKITKHFGGLAAVNNVKFDIYQGEVMGLIGPNGAGKTTLFNLISGSLPTTTGEIRYRGKIISGMKPHQICKKGLARTFQSAQLFAGLTVFENALAASLFGTKRAISLPDAKREATELLEFVGLSAVKDTPAKDLTLVNQKRLEVARALATRPEMLLLDEVMAGLNPTEVAEAMELVTRIHDKGITLFIIEHIMKAIMSICDRIMVLHHGEKIAEGTPEEIANSKTVIDVYLGE